MGHHGDSARPRVLVSVSNATKLSDFNAPLPTANAPSENT
jgi:hypothetical protein